MGCRSPSTTGVLLKSLLLGVAPGTSRMLLPPPKLPLA
jgi:hypothetical protein